MCVSVDMLGGFGPRHGGGPAGRPASNYRDADTNENEFAEAGVTNAEASTGDSTPAPTPGPVVNTDPVYPQLSVYLRNAAHKANLLSIAVICLKLCSKPERK